MTAPTTYEIGTTLVGMVTLASLNIPDPESQFIEYAASTRLGDGRVRGMGYPQTTWHYGFLKNTWYDILRAYCTGASANIFIATMDNNQDWVRYTAVIAIPDRFIVRATRYIDVTLNFTQMVEAE